MSILCLVMHILCTLHVLRLISLSGFFVIFMTKSGFFYVIQVGNPGCERQGRVANLIRLF